MFVIDASAILAWCFLDEIPKDSAKLLAQFRLTGLAAPAHWPLEVVNILGLAQRKGRVSALQIDEFLELVEGLDVEIDAETAQRAWVETRALGIAHGLTSYDAAYLELALRKGARLVTKDADLIGAAKALKVSVIDLSV